MLDLIPNTATKFGLFHTSLIVGPYLLEWTEGSLCIPKSIGDSSALLAADITSISTLKVPIDQVIDRLAKLIVKWNTEYNYCVYRITGKQDNEGNCQDFVDSVLETLGVSFKPTGALKACIDTMRNKGVFEARYNPHAKARELAGLAESYLFESHEELDLFSKNLFNKIPGFRLEFQDDFKLLKSFDRAFWTRHLKVKDAMYRPLTKQCDENDDESLECACPFLDPRATRSYYNS